jgi:hypothetical protein
MDAPVSSSFDKTMVVLVPHPVRFVLVRFVVDLMAAVSRPNDIGRDYVLEVCRAITGGKGFADDMTDRRTPFFTAACQRSVEVNCGLFLSDGLAREYHESRKKTRMSSGTPVWNLTVCLTTKYGVTPKMLFPEVSAEAQFRKEEQRKRPRRFDSFRSCVMRH